MTKVYLVYGMYPNRKDNYSYISNVFTNKKKAEAYMELMKKISNEGKTPFDKNWKTFYVKCYGIDTTDYGIPF